MFQSTCISDAPVKGGGLQITAHLLAAGFPLE